MIEASAVLMVVPEISNAPDDHDSEYDALHLLGQSLKPLTDVNFGKFK